LAAGALRDAGWNVDTAPDGLLALDRLRQAPCDLVVAELGLPGLDTFAFIREARRHVPGVRVMIVTAHSSETAAIEALNLGVAGYLVKPSRATEIAAAAARILGGNT
jgi:DNA-binding response OmpR family regulator